MSKKPSLQGNGWVYYPSPSSMEDSREVYLGGFSGLWINLLLAPSHPSMNSGQWPVQVSPSGIPGHRPPNEPKGPSLTRIKRGIPTHSGLATTDSHRLPHGQPK